MHPSIRSSRPASRGKRFKVLSSQQRGDEAAAGAAAAPEPAEVDAAAVAAGTSPSAAAVPPPVAAAAPQEAQLASPDVNETEVEILFEGLVGGPAVDVLLDISGGSPFGPGDAVFVAGGLGS